MPKLKEEKLLAPPLLDHRNINVGKVRIPWVQGVKTTDPESWVLPGGRRTTDFAEAYACAVRLAAMTDPGLKADIPKIPDWVGR